MITGGGIGTILAVTLICVFLVWTVFALFVEGELSRSGTGDQHLGDELVHATVDEYGLLIGSLFRDGSVVVRRLDNGEVVGRRAAFDRAPLAWAASSSDETLAWANADSELVLGGIRFDLRFPLPDELPDKALGLAPGQVMNVPGGLLERTLEGTFRTVTLDFHETVPIEPGLDVPIHRLVMSTSERSTVLAILTEDHRLFRAKIRESRLVEGEYSIKTKELPFELAPGASPPAHFAINELGNSVTCAFEDGRALRYDVRAGDAVLAESLDLVESPTATITAFERLLGDNTILVGDSEGRVTGWFTALEENSESVDGLRLVPAHDFGRGPGAVTAFASSSRSRSFVTVFDEGTVRVSYMSNEATIAEGRSQVDDVRLVRVSPKEDGLVVFGAEGYERWNLDAGHPEATYSSFFRPTWYEGYPGPSHTWQAESGTDDTEPKFGFMPLVFGTLKATFYSMLFGAPLALLAALFTSEFLDRRLRVPVKSSIEVMASLPSVVLGYVAGLVIAPFVQSALPAVLACFLTVPVALLLGAYGWQLLPQQWALKNSGWQRFLFMALAIPLGLGLGSLCGPLIESIFFAGDVFAWLDGRRGSGMSGLVLLLLPMAALVVAFLGTVPFAPAFRRLTFYKSRRGVALADFARFGVGVAATLALAWFVALVLSATGVDPRGGVFGTFDQKNSLVVGFAMGFAVVPIIYTLAEDALTSVPQHLRLASLGAGATQWQTAMRIVVPTAMSGIFGALMIGLGRAVGETMIVLMATGNTPVMNANVFDGFRSLAANIAFEMPEAVPGSTHYRALFLAGLVLFAMTFVLNTVAEFVRLRYRKRSRQL